MPIAYTSRVALAAIVNQLSTLQRSVYLTIKGWDTLDRGPGPSIEDIAAELIIKESSVCGRIAELKELEAITTGPMKINATGKPAQTYIAKTYRDDTQQIAALNGQMNLL